MATFTCWCGCVIRESSHPQNAGHIVWDSTEGFYDSVAEAIQGFYDAKELGNSSEWLNDFFGQQYPTDASSGEVISDIVLTQSLSHKGVIKHMHGIQTLDPARLGKAG